MRQESRIPDAEPATYEGRLFFCTRCDSPYLFFGARLNVMWTIFQSPPIRRSEK